jgi:hypothetical protein
MAMKTAMTASCQSYKFLLFVMTLPKQPNHQPTKKLTKGGIAQAQDAFPGYVKTSLRRKRLAGIGKRFLTYGQTATLDVLTLTIFMSWLTALMCSGQGLLLLVGG